MKGFLNFVTVLVLFSAVNVVRATVEVEEAQPAVSVSAEVGVASKYVGDKTGQVYENGPVVQSEVVVSVPWFDISVWNNSSLERRAGHTDGDEIDYTISRTDTLFISREIGTMDVEYGVSYYDFSKLCHGNKGDAMAYFLEVSRVMECLTDKVPFPVINYVCWEVDVSNPGSDFEGGNYFTWGFRGITDEAKSVRGVTDWSLNRDDGAYGEDPDWIFAYNLSIEIDKWGWTFSPKLTLTAPFHGEGQTVFAVSASREF